jgi:phospholipase/lecithinase/hemolysin
MLLSWILTSSAVAVAASNQHRGGNAAFDTLVTFGDSYTDNGRLSYYISHGGSAPSPGQTHSETNKTASGGLSWAQFAARTARANLADYAVSGATCSNKIVERYFATIKRSFPSVMDDEMPSFQADIAYKTLFPKRTASNTVYALWIGTNDLGQGAFLTDSVSNPPDCS